MPRDQKARDESIARSQRVYDTPRAWLREDGLAVAKTDRPFRTTRYDRRATTERVKKTGEPSAFIQAELCA